MQVRPPDSAIAALVALLATVALACDAKAPGASPPDKEAAAAAKSGEAEMAHERPMMIVFSRDYCAPCQIMKPWVAEFASENPKIDVVTVNVDRKKYEHIGSFFKVTSVPSLVYAEADGRVVKRTNGLAKKQQMTKTLRELGWAL